MTVLSSIPFCPYNGRRVSLRYLPAAARYMTISSGRIGVQRDEETGLYLFPDRLETLEAFRQLRDGQRTELRA
jgi:hypothetical protein